MPIIPTSSLITPPTFQIGKHLQTILPSFRRVNGLPAYTRERVSTSDEDFIDIDWLQNKHKKLVVLTHGLEGNSTRPYILGMAKIFYENNWDVAAWNCRSCSGEMNRNFRLYNHGNIEDITTVINHATQRFDYQEVVLVGFSMGGNISLKYAALNRHPSVTKVVAFSAPLDMRTSISVMLKPKNWLYKYYFIKNLMPKVALKAQQFPDKLDINILKNNKDWDFRINTFFCTINGYTDMEDFYQKGSAKNFLDKIDIPALIIQAQNDPMLTTECFQKDLIKNLKNVYLETPQYGGHCGFMMRGDNDSAWSERRAFEFVTNAYKMADMPKISAIS